MSDTRYSLIILIFLNGFATLAQSPFELRWEPGLSLTQKLNSQWSANLSFGGLYNIDDLNSERFAEQGLNRLDARLFLTYKFFDLSSLSGGYMYRKYSPFDSIGYEHRITEQYSFIWNINAYRLGNRIRLEQRIRNSGFVNRLRYRFSIDFPFSGQEIDPYEFYVITSEELLFSFNSSRQVFGNRIEAGLGYQISSSQKLELRLQHRMETSSNTQALHLVTNLYYRF